MTGVQIEDREDEFVVTFASDYVPRWYAWLQPALNMAAPIDDDARRFLRLFGRHAQRRRGFGAVSGTDDVALFAREYTRAEAAEALGCSPQWVGRLKNGPLAGYWFGRPGGTLVFDADAVDAYKASRDRGRSISSRPSGGSTRRPEVAGGSNSPEFQGGMTDGEASTRSAQE